MTDSAVADAHDTPATDHGVVALAIFIASETMFFAGLISAFFILRAGSFAWPPPGQPRLPVAVTGVNTVLLLASGVTMYWAIRAIRADHRRALSRWLGATALLGSIFLGVQGFEWIRLSGYGLTFGSGLFGAAFYTLIGTHAFHVAGAMVALLVVLRRSLKAAYSAGAYRGVEMCWLYWSFVVLVWPFIYVLAYLS